MWMYNLGPDSDVAISTRIRLARNLKDIKFPNIMTDEEAEYVKEQIKNTYKDLVYIETKDLDDLTLLSLIEKHLISKELAENDIYSALLMNEDASTCIMINEEDHIRIQQMQAGYDIDLAYKKILKLDEKLAKENKIAYSEKYGYLTACPTNVGSAIRVSVMLHLPGLVETGYINPLIDEAVNLGLTIRGIYGEGTESVGDMFQISNQIGLGASEEDIIAKIKIVIARIIERERAARKVIIAKDKYIEDEMYRAYGILKYARRISTSEAHTLISTLKMGTNMGIIHKVDLLKLNKLTVDINPYTLQLNKRDVLLDDDRDTYRATYIRKELE